MLMWHVCSVGQPMSHCGHSTLTFVFPFCFSSTQRWMQAWWTHFAVPRHLKYKIVIYQFKNCTMNILIVTVKRGKISEGKCSKWLLSTLTFFPLCLKDNDFAHFFDNGTKLKKKISDKATCKNRKILKFVAKINSAN